MSSTKRTQRPAYNLSEAVATVAEVATEAAVAAIEAAVAAEVVEAAVAAAVSHGGCGGVIDIARRHGERSRPT
jgi:hypothetical protein